MLDLRKIKSPILFHGDEKTAYRDPAIFFHEDMFYLYYSLVEIEDAGIHSYTALSTSTDLLSWGNPKKLTPKDQRLNFSSPGNVVRFNDEWILCLQTYPRPDYTVDQIPRYGDETSRIFLMRSRNLENWSEPELMRVKGDVPADAMGRMIDPYLLEDKDEAGLWWCFYKQAGVSMSYSRDLETWTYYGRADSGENVCVIVEDNNYIMFHSPHNGIGVKKSTNLSQWHDSGTLITLGQENWSWAKGRLTAGAVINLKHVEGIEKYLMVFHGSGPETEKLHFDTHASLGIAWSHDLKTWSWPGKERNVPQDI